ncbi:MAG: flagellar hook-length control protein FliK [Lachnospiraceae bacterium]|nr:flagellar hook-length control protein FliK [Lachnospiraceae bacterium]
MAINLLGNLNTNSAYNTQANTGIDQSTAAQLTQISDSRALMAQIKALMPGQTIAGQLVEQEGKSLQLLLNNNVLLNTTLDSQTALTTGQNISFEVKSNNNGQLVLRPLHLNVSNQATAFKALESANVQVNDATLKMVDSLMKEGMPINRETLQSINRDINMFPQADVNDIVMLHKLNMPVNEANIEQMHLYNNNNQWMLENVSDLSEDLTQLFTQAADEPEVLNKLASELEKLFSQDEAVAESTENKEQVPLEKETLLTEDGKTIIREEDTAQKQENINSKNVFDILKQATPEKMKDPAFAKSVKAALNDAISNKMLMEPEKVADKEYIKNYYDKVKNITGQLEEVLAQNGKSETALAKDVSQIRNNVDFMNQINELYNYVQLPLKMAGAQANGDLYVYAKKKNSAQRDADEPLTALLHLSMDALGNMDIFLKLQNEKLSTKFCLEREELIDFVEEHIDELNERLIEKGYNIDTTVGKLEDKERTVIDNIKSESPQISVLSTQAFDARA